MSETLQKQNYKQTEVGLIPEGWEVIRLGDNIKLKNGYAFKSEYFSKTGPIVMTPGNFKLDGGLKFEERNTIRFSGLYTREMCFNNGDLITVMTDLTPDCNLLGKSGIVDSNEILLHNQRIGKIIILNQQLDKRFLNVYFNSWIFSNRMKSTATGSTVRHTSVPTIKNTALALPTLTEQNAIATALSDMDELLTSLEQLISKKQAIKQGAMQELLTPPHKGGKRLPGFSGEWEEKKLGDLALINMGQSPLSGNYNLSGNGLPLVQGNADIQKRKTIVRNYTSQITKTANRGDIIMSVRAPVGEIATASFKCCIGRGVCSIKYQNDFLYYYLIYIEHSWSKFSTGSTFDSINSNQLRGINVSLPESLKEQKAIAQVLSDMDEEIKVLEEKKDKYQKIKGGMMQELLTGKIRLV